MTWRDVTPEAMTYSGGSPTLAPGKRRKMTAWWIAKILLTIRKMYSNRRYRIGWSQTMIEVNWQLISLCHELQE